MEVTEVGAVPDDTARSLGVAKVGRPGLAQGVDNQDLGPAALRDLERREHPRVVRPWVLTGEHDEVGGVQVGERNAALAQADGLAERDAR